MPITFNDLTVIIDGERLDELFIQIPLGNLPVNPMQYIYQTVVPELNQLLAPVFISESGNIRLSHNSVSILKNNIVTLGYKVGGQCIAMKNSSPYPTVYFFNELIKNKAILPEEMALYDGENIGILPEISFINKQETKCALVHAGNNHSDSDEEVLLTNEQIEGLKKIGDLKLKYIGQAYGISSIELCDNEDFGKGVLFYLSEKILNKTNYELRDLVRIFVLSPLDTLVKKVLTNNSTQADYIKLIKLESESDDQKISFEFNLEKVPTEFHEAIFLSLEISLQYIRFSHINPDITLLPKANNTLQEQSICSKKLVATLKNKVDYSAYVAFLIQLPKDKDLLNTLRVTSSASEEQMDRLIQDILKKDEPLAKLHQSSRRQSSCLTNAVIF